MRRFKIATMLYWALTTWLACSATAWAADDRDPAETKDWPQWRGPKGNGVASSDQKPPTTWSESQNVVWKAEVPGRGHGSPTVVNDHVYLATADEQANAQSVLCYDRSSGKLLWKTDVHDKGAMKKHRKSSAASSSVACDGKQVYNVFANDGGVFVTTLDTHGGVLWQKRVCDYVIYQGFGASPVLYKGLIIVSGDSPAGGAIAGLDQQSGEIVWKHDRPKLPNYTSPAVIHVDSKDQLIFGGCDLVTSLDPLSGKLLWEFPAGTTECVSTMVSDGKHIFPSGGYPRNYLMAMVADGSGKIAWEKNDKLYVPSALVHDGHLFAVLDNGVAKCWNCETGDEAWKARLGGDFTASPVLVGETLYATNEIGETFVFRADPQKFTQLAVNKLGDETLASPAICDSQIFLRTVHKNDSERQEMLYCLGQ